MKSTFQVDTGMRHFLINRTKSLLIHIERGTQVSNTIWSDLKKSEFKEAVPSKGENNPQDEPHLKNKYLKALKPNQHVKKIRCSEKKNSMTISIMTRFEREKTAKPRIIYFCHMQFVSSVLYSLSLFVVISLTCTGTHSADQASLKLT